MNLFYQPDINDHTIELNEMESKHAVRVLRLRKGDPVQLVDGRGGWYEAVIEEDHPKRCRLLITSHTPEYQPLPYHLHLAVSPTKSMDRFEWFLEKATEIGISEITPLLCQRTERAHLNTGRLERVVVSAMKQSLRAYKPLLNKPVEMMAFLEGKVQGIKGIAHCIPERDDGPQKRKSIKDLTGSGPFTLLVGPEGDFTAREVEAALSAGYLPFHLGTSRLRTETAAVHICSAVNLHSFNG